MVVEGVRAERLFGTVGGVVSGRDWVVPMVEEEVVEMLLNKSTAATA